MTPAVTAPLEKRPIGSKLPRVIVDHVALAQYWRLQALVDNDVRLADDICFLLEALYSTHILVKRRSRKKSWAWQRRKSKRKGK